VPCEGILAANRSPGKSTRYAGRIRVWRARRDRIVANVAIHLQHQSTVRQPSRRSIMRRAVLVLTTAIAFAAAPAIAQQSGPSDAQIAHIVVTANQVDIDAGKLAKAKSKNKDVKAFGQQMINDHTGVNKQATALVKKLKVKPEDNDTSKSLKQGGKENIAALKKLKGAEFDRAYIDHEVDYHQQVVDAIDKTLLPSAQNAQLKNLITKVRPAIVAHLEHAKQIQGKLGK
jgi:putative membrane protein